jgi:dimethylargininase
MPQFTAANMIAITRPVSASINDCELTHLNRERIDIERARQQHAAYERAVEAAGCTIENVYDVRIDLPDAVFVEDAAIICDEVALVTRPGAESRRAETPPVAELLRRYRPVHVIEAPATIDGGDVLVAGRTVYIGRSGRTNDVAVEEVRRLLGPHGYQIHTVPVTGCLHLKSAVTALADDRLLINSAWVNREAFSAIDLIDIDPREPAAANVLRIDASSSVRIDSRYTCERLEQLGFWSTLSRSPNWPRLRRLLHVAASFSPFNLNSRNGNSLSEIGTSAHRDGQIFPARHAIDMEGFL